MSLQQEDLAEWERLLAAERHLQYLVPGTVLVRGTADIESSRALWNRSRLDLESDEVIAQLLDRGEMETRRVLYRLARADPRLRAHQVGRADSSTATPAVLVGCAGQPRRIG